MKYQNAGEILPPELLQMVQDYIQGGYLYVPKRDEKTAAVPTRYQVELQKRDRHIYEKYLQGMSGRELAVLYHLSRSSIRRVLQKERQYYEEMKVTVQQILSRWGLAPCAVKQIYTTAWEVDGQYILKVYEDTAALRRNLLIQTTLRGMSIPAASVIPALDGAQWVYEDGKGYMLMEKLSGGKTVSIKTDAQLPYRMGEIIGRLHQAFLRCEKEISFWDNSLLDELNGWVKEQLAADNWSLVSEEAFSAVISRLSAEYDRLPRQLIHRDVHFGNFLFDMDGSFSGYIDFDLTQRNIRVFDLAYFLLGLLSEKENGLGKEDWLRILDGVLKGYQRQTALTDAEKRALLPVMEGIELLFIAYYLQVDDRCAAEESVKLLRFAEENEEEITRRCIRA